MKNATISSTTVFMLSRVKRNAGDGESFGCDFPQATHAGMWCSTKFSAALVATKIRKKIAMRHPARSPFGPKRNLFCSGGGSAAAGSTFAIGDGVYGLVLIELLCFSDSHRNETSLRDGTSSLDGKFPGSDRAPKWTARWPRKISTTSPLPVAAHPVALLKSGVCVGCSPQS